MFLVFFVVNLYLFFLKDFEKWVKKWVVILIMKEMNIFVYILKEYICEKMIYVVCIDR